MKWKLFRLFFPFLVIGFVAPMIIPGPDGERLMSWRDWLPDKTSLVKLTNKFRRLTEVVDPQGDVAPTIGLLKAKKVYRWQDKTGSWHFSDQPDAATGVVTEQSMPEIYNMLPPVFVPSPQADLTADSVAPGFKLSPATIPVQDIPQLFEDAKAIQGSADERSRRLKEI